MCLFIVCVYTFACVLHSSRMERRGGVVFSFYHVGLGTKLHLSGLAAHVLPAELTPQPKVCKSWKL